MRRPYSLWMGCSSGRGNRGTGSRVQVPARRIILVFLTVENEIGGRRCLIERSVHRIVVMEREEERKRNRRKQRVAKSPTSRTSLPPHHFHFHSSPLSSSHPSPTFPSPSPSSLPLPFAPLISLFPLNTVAGQSFWLPGESLSPLVDGEVSPLLSGGSVCRPDFPGPAIRGSPANLPHPDSFISWLAHRDRDCLLSTLSNSKSSGVI